MKKILEIINLPGSAQNFIGEQFKYFRENGNYEMHLICSPGSGIEVFCEKNNVNYFPLKIERRPSPISDLKALCKIFKYIRRNKIDIVISHQEKSRLLGTVAAWLNRVPVRIIYAHGVLLDTMQGLKRKFFLAEGKMVSRLAHKIVCVSPSVMTRRVDIGMDKPEKQVLIGKGTCNGIDTINKFNSDLVSSEDCHAIRHSLNLDEDDFVVGFCGRIVRDKGIIELVKAIEILSQRHKDKSIKLLVIGAFEKRDAVPVETAEFLKNSPLVKFTGRVPFDEIQKYYTPMNVLVLPSYREGFGLVTTEAGAMGVPAIVSRSTGCIDSIIENETGVYCDIDPNDIANKIELFFNKDYSIEMGMKARQFVRDNFEHKDVMQNTLDFINQIANDNIK
jgi:glycosyltransferase involved in cell wall biosynthesis